MTFPPALSSYADPPNGGMWDVIKARAAAEPFNITVTVIFLLAVLHTFFCPKLMHLSHTAPKASPRARILHILGEVELVFALWVLVLAGAFALAKGPGALFGYLGKVSYTEPIFVVVIMALASTRPVMRLAEQALRLVASLGGGRPVAWWLSILTVAPLLGSLITEPAAMTIAALLLAKQFYVLNPSSRLKYATLGLLFVNISIGGTLTHFAAPPVLMVAAAWGWNLKYMLMNFGWHAVSGIVMSNVVYLLVFRKELLALQPLAVDPKARPEEAVPAVGDDSMHLCCSSASSSGRRIIRFGSSRPSWCSLALCAPRRRTRTRWRSAARCWLASFWPGSSCTAACRVGGSSPCSGAWARCRCLRARPF
jgi:hypothetical protein